MHPEIVEIIYNTCTGPFIPDAGMLVNAEKLLDYLDDLNLERKNRFETTPAESLYLLWETEEIEFHFECLKNGKVQYTFRKNGYGLASGSNTISEFLPVLQQHLLTAIC